MKRPLLLFAVALLLILSCSPDRRGDGPAVRSEEKHLISREVPLADSGSYGVTVQFSYPDILGSTPDPLADSLRGHVIGYIFAPLDDVEGDTVGVGQMAEELATDYRALQEEFPEYAIPWEVRRVGNVAYDSGGIVTVRLDEYAFLGGAHGLETSRLASFSAENGKRLTASELFLNGSEEGIGKLIEEEFRRARGIGAEASLSDAGFWVEEGKFPVSENWGVVRGGILFYYAPYEIGPYAVGQTEVRVSLEALRPYLDQKGVLGGE